MSDIKEGEFGNLVSKKEYIEERLKRIAGIPEALEKSRLENISLAVAVFGGLVVAIVFLHTSIINPILAVLLSMLASFVGILLSLMFLTEKKVMHLGIITTRCETDVLLEELNRDYTNTIDQKIQYHYKKEIDKEPRKYGLDCRALDYHNIILGLLKWVMTLYLGYLILVLVSIMLCPTLFKTIW